MADDAPDNNPDSSSSRLHCDILSSYNMFTLPPDDFPSQFPADAPQPQHQHPQHPQHHHHQNQQQPQQQHSQHDFLSNNHPSMPFFTLPTTYSSRVINQTTPNANTDDMMPSPPSHSTPTPTPPSPPPHPVAPHADWPDDIDAQSPRIVQAAAPTPAPHTPHMSAVTTSADNQQSTQTHNHNHNHQQQYVKYNNNHDNNTFNYPPLQTADVCSPMSAATRATAQPSRGAQSTSTRGTASRARGRGTASTRGRGVGKKGRSSKHVLDVAQNIDVGYICGYLRRHRDVTFDQLDNSNQKTNGEEKNDDDDEETMMFNNMFDDVTTIVKEITEEMKVQERCRKRLELKRKSNGEHIDPKTASRLEASLSRFRKDLVIQVLLEQVKVHIRNEITMRRCLQQAGAALPPPKTTSKQESVKPKTEAQTQDHRNTNAAGHNHTDDIVAVNGHHQQLQQQHEGSSSSDVLVSSMMDGDENSMSLAFPSGT